jgi:protein subunit release factor A
MDVARPGSLREEDIRVDVWRNAAVGDAMRCSVRVTHLPTGIVVTASGTTSQLEAKARALGDLREHLGIRGTCPVCGHDQDAR